MNILKSHHAKGNNGIKTEELKTFLNDSRIKLKKVACSATVREEIQKELTEICTEIYEVNESIPGDENAALNQDTLRKIVRTSERISKLEAERDIASESSEVINTIVSKSLIIKQHFQTRAISAIG
ncbi:MAG: hypothetical protein WC788_05785 [Candidatus Paceibacterota bacterium]